jgi:predicted AAA+ superfamily ATPase
MEHKRLTLFAGHYGSGKTNIAVNYALLLAKEGKKVSIADLDIVNPYFRTKDSEKELEKAGVELISPQFANSNVDLPALPAKAYKLVTDRETYGIMDIGGDDRGAYALGRYVPSIVEENNYRMVFVANCFRPLTKTPEEALEIMREIEEACALKFTDIINNSNLGNETDEETILSSIEFIEKLSKISALPVFAHSMKTSVAEKLSGKLTPILPLELQKKIF